MKKKHWVLLLAMVLVAVGVIGGTLAWFTDKAEGAVNVFTIGNIEIGLSETSENYQMVPGGTIVKDPTVTVFSGSADCYLFVKLEESENFAGFLNYTPADGWTQGTGTGTEGNGVPTNVYFRTVTNITSDRTFGVLLNNQVSVKKTITQAMMNGLTENTYPTLTVVAYACQLYKNGTDAFTPAEAWTTIGG